MAGWKEMLRGQSKNIQNIHDTQKSGHFGIKNEIQGVFSNT